MVASAIQDFASEVMKITGVVRYDSPLFGSGNVEDVRV